MRQFVILMMVLLGLGLLAEVREVKPDLNQLPSAIPPTPTLAEILEEEAWYDAVAARQEAVDAFVPDIGTNNTSVAISNQVVAIREKLNILSGLDYAIADTRTNIIEVATLTDTEIAFLYLAQMKKDVEPLTESAPTNTIEYAIGAGIREDLEKE